MLIWLIQGLFTSLFECCDPENIKRLLIRAISHDLASKPGIFSLLGDLFRIGIERDVFGHFYFSGLLKGMIVGSLRDLKCSS